MNCSTTDRHRHAPSATVIRVEIISNDPVDHLRTLRAADGSNPQQSSSALREARVERYAQEMQVPMVEVIEIRPGSGWFTVYLTVADGAKRVSTFTRVRPGEFRRHGVIRAVARVLTYGERVFATPKKRTRVCA